MKAVLIGPSNSGKTTILEQLASRGWNTHIEIPRHVLISDKDADVNHKQYKMWVTQKLIEERYKNQNMIYERGLPCILYYTKIYAPQISHIMNDDLKNKYDLVFYFEQLNTEFSDGVRTESCAEESRKLNEIIRDSYEKLGHKIIDIPIKPIFERTDMIEKILYQHRFNKN